MADACNVLSQSLTFIGTSAKDGCNTGLSMTREYTQQLVVSVIHILYINQSLHTKDMQQSTKQIPSNKPRECAIYSNM